MRGSRGGVTALTVLALAGGAAGCGKDDAEAPAAQQRVQTADRALQASREPVPAPEPTKEDAAEAAQSFATAPGVKLTKTPPSPAKAARDAKASEAYISPGAPSDAQIAAELKQMEAVLAEQAKSGGGGTGITLESDGTATPASDVPAVVKRVIAGANAIAKFPYVYGGGHGSFVDTAYDCSGSLSYALAAAGLLDRTMTSGDLARTGEKGPGKWITIYANEGHTFMTVNGLRYDTSGRGGPLGTRWNASPRSTKGFAVRHPPGL